MSQKTCTTRVKSSHFCHIEVIIFFDGQRCHFHQFLVILLYEFLRSKHFLNVSNNFLLPPHKPRSNTGFFIDLK